MPARNPQLHAAVLANPDDDAPRLVYADWLSERGDPWGELIAVQIARAGARTPELDARERELLEDKPYWTVYRRGFVEVLTCSSGDLDELLADTCVRDLRIREDQLQRGQGARIAAALPRMRLRSLALGTMTDDDLATLLAALDESLEALSYGWGPGSVPAAQVIAMTKSRLRLSSLALSGITADAVPTLAAWHPLRSLSLEGSDIGRGAVVDGPAFVRLEHLELSYTNIGVEDVYAIARSTMPLVTLGLTGNVVGPDAARCIASTPRFAALRRLRLAMCEIGDEGLEALLASPYLPRDMTLCLESRALGLPQVVEGPGNIWVEPGDDARANRIRARFAIESDGPTIVQEP